jgi:hypothetical protein
MKLLLPAMMLVLFVIPAARVHGIQATLLTDVPGRIVVETTYPVPFPEDLTLTFADADGRAVADITVSEKFTTTNFTPSGRGGIYGDVRLMPDGTFSLKVPRGEHRLLLRRRPNSKVGSVSALADYFVKSVQAGATNLLEKPMVVTSSFAGELVITFSKCTAETKERCL